MPEQSDRLKFLTNGELREEIAYTVGGDPSRYGAGSSRQLTKGVVQRVAIRVQPAERDVALAAMELAELYEHVCECVGYAYEPPAGDPWGLRRGELKAVHRALDARPPREVVSP